MINKFINSFVFTLSVSAGYAQVVAPIEAPSGPYTSEDGRYTVDIKFADGNLTVVEPNKTSVYTPAGNNLYEFTNPTNGRHYKIQVESPRALAAFGSTGKTYFHFTGTADVKSRDHFDFYKKMSDDYMAKVSSDPNDARLWTFCAAAALQRAKLNDQGFEEYAKETILSIRLILEDQSACPCADAIPPTLWKKYQQP